MASCTRFLIYSALILFLITGCSGKGNPSAPDTVVDTPVPLELTGDREISEYTGSHFPLFHNLIYMNVTDPENVEYEIVPLREGFMHLNILKFLEVSPCTDCFEITNVTWPEPGRIDVDFKITHPYDDPLYTIFDVRGIMMFDGSHSFTTSGMTISDPLYGDGVFLNPDGYTSLYNTWLIGMPAPEIQEYFKGVYASENLPNAVVNGYIRHISDDPSNTRNALLTGDSVTRTYSLKYPTDEFVFGYAVDASWAVPIETPVDDPMTDFGPNANSPEPWKIVVTPFSENLTDEGGTTWLQIDVYDRGGKETHEAPLVECPELFDGYKTGGFISETENYARYHVALTNEKLASGGFYKCLISVQDNDYNPNFPWIDMKAYQVIDVRVEGKPVAVAGADPIVADQNEPVYFWSYFSYDADGGEVVKHEWDWNNDGVYDETGPEAVHSFTTGGYHHVQCRVTDDEGKTDELDEPLEITILEAGIPYNPVNVTPDWMNFRPEGVHIDGNYAYIFAYPGSLNIFDISNPDLPLILGSVALDSELESSHYRHPPIEIDGAYAFISASSWSKVINVINVSSPSNPTVVGSIDMGKEVFDIEARNDYIYVGCNGFLSVVDVSTPENPSEVDKFYLTTYPFSYEGSYQVDTGSARSVALMGDYAYVIDRHYHPDAKHYLHKVDISDPENISGVDKFEMYIQDLGVYGDHLFIFNGGVVNIWDPNLEPDGIVKSIGGLSGEVMWIDPVGVAGVVRDDAKFQSYTQGYFLDIDPVLDTYIASEFSIGSGQGHGQNGLACVVNHTSITLIDTDPPESASVTAVFEYPGECNAMATNDEYVYVATQSGIEIFDVVPLQDAHKVGELGLAKWLNAMVYENNILYVTRHGATLYILNVTNPQEPTVINTLVLPDNNSYFLNVIVEDGYAYLSAGIHFYIADIDPPESAHIVNTVDQPDFSHDLAISNGYAYVPHIINKSLLHIYDIDPPESAHLVNSIEVENLVGRGAHIEISGTYAYVPHSNKPNGVASGMLIFDLSSPENPVLIQYLQMPWFRVNNILISDNIAYLNRDAGFNAIDISSPGNAFLISASSTDVEALDSAIIDDLFFITTEFGIEVFDLW